MRLEWDARKGRENLRKHGVSFEEASSVFLDRKSTRLNSSHSQISYGAFCLKKQQRIAGRLPSRLFRVVPRGPETRPPTLDPNPPPRGPRLHRGVASEPMPRWLQRVRTRGAS